MNSRIRVDMSPIFHASLYMIYQWAIAMNIEDSPIKLRTPDGPQVKPAIVVSVSPVELATGISQVPTGTISSPKSTSRTCKTVLV
jgi:hypothetical protein